MLGGEANLEGTAGGAEISPDAGSRQFGSFQGFADPCGEGARSKRESERARLGFNTLIGVSSVCVSQGKIFTPPQ